AVKTAAEWLKFRSRIGFHIRLPPESRIHEHKFHLFHYTKHTFSNQAKNLTCTASFFPHLFFVFFFSLFWNPCSSPHPLFPERKE
ncbi:MAG: hypothetical protein KID09_26010, partial [Paenibacillus macerans]